MQYISLYFQNHGKLSYKGVIALKKNFFCEKIIGKNETKTANKETDKKVCVMVNKHRGHY
jgi:hypothetical protein